MSSSTESPAVHLTEAQRDELDRDGVTVLPGFFTRSLTERFRRHMDSVLPPIGALARIGPDGPEEFVAGTLHHCYARQFPPGAVVAELLYDSGLMEAAESVLRTAPANL